MENHSEENCDAHFSARFEKSSESSCYEDGLVSVIMPTHNSEKYLRESIESVLSQTYHHWELIIVDDGSADKSLQIAREYEKQDARVHVLTNPHPIGMPSAPRNVGIKAAKGRFIAFLDSDDIYFKDKIERQLPLFDSNEVVVVYADYEKMDADGNRNNRIIKAPQTTNYRCLLKGNVITMPAGIYDRKKVGTFYFKDKRHEDYIMWLDILRHGGLALSSGSAVAVVRVRARSVSSNKIKTVAWQWKVYREVERFSIPKSVYYFVNYAWRAFAKSLI